MSSYDARAEKEIDETRRAVQRGIREGLSPGEAINRNASRADGYRAMMEEYGLKPDIPD